jgi:hypothetical protein
MAARDGDNALQRHYDRTPRHGLDATTNFMSSIYSLVTVIIYFPFL